MIAQITYNRSTKQYEFLDEESGEILTAPSGNKHELFKTAVALADPDLYEMAHRVLDRHPHMERLVWKAVNKIMTGGVEVFPGAGNGEPVAMIDSSDEFGRWCVSSDDRGYLMCNCPAFTEMYAPLTNDGNRYCSHLLAYRLYLATKESRF